MREAGKRHSIFDPFVTNDDLAKSCTEIKTDNQWFAAGFFLFCLRITKPPFIWPAISM